MTYVVGLAGRAESGKSTAAEMLHSIVLPREGHHIEFSEPILALAQRWVSKLAVDATIEDVFQHFQDTVEFDEASTVSLIEAGMESPHLKAYLDHQTFLSPITQETKQAHRQLLEWLGRGVVDYVSPTYWSDQVRQKTSLLVERRVDFITLGGVRSAFDADTVKNFGGNIIKLTRGEVVEPLPSEVGINSWQADYAISNVGTFDDLRHNLTSVWSMISAGEYSFEKN